MANPYMPMFGNPQATMGSQFLMGMNGRNAMSTPNPQSYAFNYPKVPMLRGQKYSNYSKFKQVDEKNSNLENANENNFDHSVQNENVENKKNYSKKTEDLAIKLSEEIKKLEEITGKAEMMTGKKTTNSKSEYNDEVESLSLNKLKKIRNLRSNESDNQNKKDSNKDNAKEIKILGDLKVNKQEKEQFDLHMKEMLVHQCIIDKVCKTL